MNPTDENIMVCSVFYPAAVQDPVWNPGLKSGFMATLTMITCLMNEMNIYL